MRVRALRCPKCLYPYIFRKRLGMLSGAFPFLLSRPAIRSLHGLSRRRIDVVLTEIAASGLVREPRAGADAGVPDPGDAHLWWLLGTTPGAALVTGDRALLAHPPDFASCVSPRSFAEAIDA